MGEGLPQLLVDQAQAAVLMCQAVESVRRRLSRAQHSLRQRIHDMYPIRARIAPWLRGRLTRAEVCFAKTCFCFYSRFFFLINE